MSKTSKRFVGYMIHCMQLACLFSMTKMSYYYNNRLGFMRNIVFYSKKINEKWSATCQIMIVIAILFVTVMIILRSYKTTLEKKPIIFESVLLVLLGLLFIYWQWYFTLMTQPIFYLMLLLLFIIWGLQVMIIVIKKSF